MLKSNGILIGIKEIMYYIGIQSEQRFRKLVKAGLLAKNDQGRWYAHVDNIEDFFRDYTRETSGDIESDDDEMTDDEIIG